MTTDGGGWVLIGRGREGWSFPYWGENSPSTLRNTVTGPGAFVPSSLPTPTVDGLLNGGRMDGLADGIRLRRATNVAGTTWQEVRMKVKTFGSLVLGLRRRHPAELDQLRRHHDRPRDVHLPDQHHRPTSRSPTTPAG